jgi:DNA-binding transcriptional regulator YiaG
MSERKLKPDSGRRANSIKDEEQRALVASLMETLTAKATRFLAGDYHAPTGEELTAVRKQLGMSMKVAAFLLGVSERTWLTREGKVGSSEMPPQEFAMLVLFFLRKTPSWALLMAQLMAKLPARQRQVPGR